MNVSLKNFLPNIYPHVRDCNEISAIVALRDACRDFCKRTNAWQYDSGEIVFRAGTSEVSVEVPPGAAVASLLNVYVGSTQLVYKSREHLFTAYGPDWRTMQGQPRYYFHNASSGSIVIVPQPDKDMTGSMLVACMPTSTSRDMDGDILDRYSEAIVYGAVARLCDTPNRPYSDQRRASDLFTRYSRAAAQAKRDTEDGRTEAPTSVRMRRF